MMTMQIDDDYADICGITEKELLDTFQEGIASLAAKRREEYDETCRLLKLHYDGYRFAPEGSEIYNPWSVLNCLQKSRIGAYWNATGATSVVAEALHASDVDIEKTINTRWRLDRLAGLDLRNTDPTALLYQTGYLTIADYDFRKDTVSLKIPNNEVKEGLFKDLLQFYVKVNRGSAENVVSNLIDCLESGKPEEMMENLDSYFAGIPYDLKIENENNFHNALYILLTLIGVDTTTEVHTSDCRIDLLIETQNYIYIIELKYDSTPQEALLQIEEKQYARKFSTDYRRLFRIGVNFSSKHRRINGWEIEG